MNTKDMPGYFDGMQRAKPNEPVFPLRGHDTIAPKVVHYWVQLRREEINRAFHAGEITDEKRTLELIQCREAEEIAWSMVEWQKQEHGEAEELEAKARYDDIRDAHTKLHNSIAEVSAAAREVLAP